MTRVLGRRRRTRRLAIDEVHLEMVRIPGPFLSCMLAPQADGVRNFLLIRSRVRKSSMLNVSTSICLPESSSRSSTNSRNEKRLDESGLDEIGVPRDLALQIRVLRPDPSDHLVHTHSLLRRRVDHGERPPRVAFHLQQRMDPALLTERHAAAVGVLTFEGDAQALTKKIPVPVDRCESDPVVRYEVKLHRLQSTEERPRAFTQVERISRGLLAHLDPELIGQRRAPAR